MFNVDVFVQLLTEAGFHATATPYFWSILWESCGWSDCSTLLRAGWQLDDLL